MTSPTRGERYLSSLAMTPPPVSDVHTWASQEFASLLERQSVYWPAEHRMIRRLGAGGQGVVYLAEDRAAGCRVAIKTLSPGAGGGATTTVVLFIALAAPPHLVGGGEIGLDGLALVEPLRKHVDGLVQMMDGHLEAGPAGSMRLGHMAGLLLAYLTLW